jgi:glycosyltransferase involved in cell wall biosynthesis
MMNDFPRVLVLGETFRLNGGGGITMTNLFHNWPASNIGVVTDRIDETNPLSEYKYYQLGDEEIKVPFPFHLLQSRVKSGPYSFDRLNKDIVRDEYRQGPSIRIKGTLRSLFDNFLRYTGIFFLFYRISLSESLKKFILDFKPDVIYIQPFHYRIMNFSNLLYRQLHIPYAIHIMDDSVKYINHSFLFRRFHQRRIEAEFKELVLNASIRMCISDAMGEEYYNRYGKKFLSFRNPIDTSRWLPYQKTSLEVESDTLRIIYNGRLFTPTLHSLIDMCKVVNHLNETKKPVELHIYTYDQNTEFNSKAEKMKGIKLFSPVTFDEIPGLIRQYDVFFLCLDYDKNAQKYSQFSISTRTSEGMISAVPVLLYAPSNSAMFKYFHKNEAGCLVGNRSLQELEIAIIKLWTDIEYRRRISENAIKTVLSDSNSTEIRNKFCKALTTF